MRAFLGLLPSYLFAILPGQFYIFAALFIPIPVYAALHQLLPPSMALVCAIGSPWLLYALFTSLDWSTGWFYTSTPRADPPVGPIDWTKLANISMKGALVVVSLGLLLGMYLHNAVTVDNKLFAGVWGSDDNDAQLVISDDFLPVIELRGVSAGPIQIAVIERKYRERTWRGTMISQEHGGEIGEATIHVLPDNSLSVRFEGSDSIEPQELKFSRVRPN